jgi:hypothetical protein
MSTTTEKLHYAWVQFLINSDNKEVAAIVVDGSLDFIEVDQWQIGLFANIPSAAYPYCCSTDINERIIDTLQTVAYGHIYGGYGRATEKSDISIIIRSQLCEVDSDWRERIKEEIIRRKETNQAIITEKVFTRELKNVLSYNEMKFASQSEIRIAQELENRKVLFFPLPLAVRADTGKQFEDHREVDFIVCHDGVWGILEVAFHPDRFEKDKEKDVWFKKSGILCIEHYTAEKCYKYPTDTVKEFLNTLARYKRV